MRGILIFLGLATVAEAQVEPCGRPRFSSPDEVARHSALVVRAQIEKVETLLRGNTAYTDFTLLIQETWRGTPPGSRLVVRQPGGQCAGITTVVTDQGPRPEFLPGEVWILALAYSPLGWWTLYGGSEGAFKVKGDRAIRNGESMPIRSWQDDVRTLPPPETAVLPTPDSSPRHTRSRDENESNPWILPIIAAFVILLIWILRRRGVLVLLIGILVGLAAHPARGYVRENWTPAGGGVAWNIAGQSPANYFQGGRVKYRLITSGTFAVPASYIWDAVNAAQTWTDQTNTSLGYVRGPDTTSAPFDADFSVGWTDGSGNTQWGGNIGGASGVTVYSYSGSTFIDVDIAVSSATAWTDAQAEGILLHEFGHATGLAHPPHIQDTMSYVGAWNGLDGNTTGNRRLTLEDSLADSWIYPSAGYTSTVGTIAGSITQSGTNVHQAQIGVFDSKGRLTTTTLSDAGQYRVEGLPPDTYTLRAFQTFPDSDPAGLYMRTGPLPWNSTAPTAFMTTSANDANAIVTAGGTVTANVTVPAGSSSMHCIYTTRRSGGVWTTSAQSLRLARGESGRIGVIGTNIPNSSGTLTEFTLTGSGITLTNQGFSGASTNATAPANDYPDPGDRTIAYDFSVSPSADLGIRALILRNTAYPAERYMVLGLIEVYDVGTLTSALGPANPVTGWEGPGVTNRSMLQISLTSNATEPIRLRSWTITSGGTGSPANVSAVRIVADLDSNGIAEGGETVVASGTFSGSTATLSSAYTLPAGTTQNFLVVYDFGAAVDATTYAATLTAIGNTGVNSAVSITPTGLPLTGNTMTVDASPPIGGTVNNGTGSNITQQPSATTISANWSGFSDPQSGIAGYEWAIGTSAGASNVQSFTVVGLATSATNSSLSLTNGATYYVTVRATNGGGLQTSVTGSGLTINTALPGDFTMTAPANGATGVATQPTFTWTASSGASSYSLQVATSSTFASPVINQSGIVTTSFTPASTLAPSTLHYWRVFAVNGAGQTQVGFAPRSFTTVAAPPGAFSMTAPANSAAGVAISPTFTWGAAAGAASYRLQISTSATFTSFVLDQEGIIGTSYTPNLQLAYGTTYYWRVIAVDGAGTTTATGAPFSFTTIAAPVSAPGAFNLSTPLDAATGVSTTPTFTWTAAANPTTYTVQVSTSIAFTSFVINQPGITGTSYTDPTLLATSSSFWWRVIAVNPAGSATATNAPRGFTTRAAGTGTYPFVENFESAPQGWSTTGNLWQWGVPTAGPGTDRTGAGSCYGTILGANYLNNADASLYSPAIDIPASALSPRLQFWMWMWAESGADGGHLEISVNGGAWTVVPSASLSIAYNDAAISSLLDSPNGWSGATYAVWIQVTLDLSAYLGQSVRFRFHFASNASVTYPGWHIDDFSVSDGASPPAPAGGSGGGGGGGCGLLGLESLLLLGLLHSVRRVGTEHCLK